MSGIAEKIKKYGAIRCLSIVEKVYWKANEQVKEGKLRQLKIFNASKINQKQFPLLSPKFPKSTLLVRRNMRIVLIITALTGIKINFPDKQIDSNRREILRLLISSPREGMENVIDYLYSSGFFTAPSSRDRHHNWRGGLAQHSLDVCKVALDFNRNIPKQSIIICGLLHDICKASKLYYDENGKIHQRSNHIKGHGIRSIKLLQMLGLKLNEEERLAIRWHMGGHHAQEDEKSDLERAKTMDLWRIIHKADYLDAYGKSPEL